jgi:hypothetical protein
LITAGILKLFGVAFLVASLMTLSVFGVSCGGRCGGCRGRRGGGRSGGLGGGGCCGGSGCSCWWWCSDALSIVGTIVHLLALAKVTVGVVESRSTVGLLFASSMPLCVSVWLFSSRGAFCGSLCGGGSRGACAFSIFTEVQKEALTLAFVALDIDESLVTLSAFLAGADVVFLIVCLLLASSGGRC